MALKQSGSLSSFGVFLSAKYSSSSLKKWATTCLALLLNFGRLSSFRSVQQLGTSTDKAFTFSLQKMSGTLFTLTLHAEILQVFTALTLVLLEFSEWLCGETVALLLPWPISSALKSKVWCGVAQTADWVCVASRPVCVASRPVTFDSTWLMFKFTFWNFERVLCFSACNAAETVLSSYLENAGKWRTVLTL